MFTGANLPLLSLSFLLWAVSKHEVLSLIWHESTPCKLNKQDVLFCTQLTFKCKPQITCAHPSGPRWNVHSSDTSLFPLMGPIILSPPSRKHQAWWTTSSPVCTYIFQLDYVFFGGCILFISRLQHPQHGLALSRELYG